MLAKQDDGGLVLGIDPGLADTGYGAVRRHGSRLTMVACGTLKTAATLSDPQRLQLLAQQLREIFGDLKPQTAAFEELFFSKNVRSAMAVGQARGVSLLVAVEAGAEVHEYSPSQVKLSVTGYGGATKAQMLKMVQAVLGTRNLPHQDDAIDALAIAICHQQGGRLRAVLSRTPVLSGRNT